MARCPSCEYPLPDDRDRVGARCPHCRDPLYEPAGRAGRPAREGEGSCPVHAGIETVGVCARCKVYVCEVCRTRWRDQIVCAACVERALGANEATPGQDRDQRRQARLALVLGLSAWLASGLAATVGWWSASRYGGAGQVVVLLFAVFLVLAGDVLVAAVGVGQAAAALRVRGSRRGLALVGLVLGGLYVGAFLGVGACYLWLT